MSRRNASLSTRLAKKHHVTGHEEAIEALRRAEQKYRSIFENASEGIFQTTPDGRYLSANPALARMYGYDSPTELLSALTDIDHQLYVKPGRRAEFTRAMRQDGHLVEFESQIYRRDGSTLWISENARAVHDEVSGELLYYEGMVLDITRRKRAEEAREIVEARKAAQYAVTRALADATHLSEAAGKILQAVCQNVGWELGRMWRVDKGMLRHAGSWHLPERELLELAETTCKLTFAPGAGLPGRVWATNQAEWMKDIAGKPGSGGVDRAETAGLHAAFAVPLSLENGVIGVMEFFSRQVREPDDDLLSIISAMGTQIAQFVERERIAGQLARSVDELAAKNSQLEADLEMARDLQQVLLTQKYPSFPRPLPPEESWLQFCHRYRPAERVGGDFFCVLPLSETDAGVLICDVLGHGVRAALVTAIVRGLVEELAPLATDPGRLLTEINGSLVAILRQTETPMLVTAFYLVINVTDGRMRYANAGHPHPFHVQRGTGVVEPLRLEGRPGPVLGVFAQAVYQNGCRVASPDDLVALFTDGLFEVEMENHEYFGEERLLAEVRKRMQLPAGELFDDVMAEIQANCPSGHFADDVCLLGVELRRTDSP
jgi:PAS domain S-box-containing protein